MSPTLDIDHIVLRGKATSVCRSSLSAKRVTVPVSSETDLSSLSPAWFRSLATLIFADSLGYLNLNEYRRLISLYSTRTTVLLGKKRDQTI